jgi:hypothetical protein
VRPRPVATRRSYGGRTTSIVINRQFSTSERGFLAGPPRVWAAQLTDLVLAHGLSVFIFAPGRDVSSDLRRFAEEVAPSWPKSETPRSRSLLEPLGHSTIAL